MLYCRESETFFLLLFSLCHSHEIETFILFIFNFILYGPESETVSTDAILSFGPVPFSDSWWLGMGTGTPLFRRFAGWILESLPRLSF